MTDASIWAMASTAAFAGLCVVVVAGLKGWRDWLALQARALDQRRPPEAAAGAGLAARIELADLKERVRKLEAIAAGVDL